VAEYERLKRIHEVACVRFSAAAKTKVPVGDYRRLSAAAAEAWLDAECARLELEQHKKGHAIAN